MPPIDEMLTIDPPPCVLHDRDHRLAGEKGRRHVDVERVVPVLDRDRRQRAARPHPADIVVQHVDAPVGRHARLDRRRHRIRLRHVGRPGGRLAALRFDDSGGLLCGLDIDVDGEDLRALAPVDHRRRLAVAPAGPDRARAGHQRDLAGQPVAPFHLFRHRAPLVREIPGRSIASRQCRPRGYCRRARRPGEGAPP